MVYICYILTSSGKSQLHYYFRYIDVLFNYHFCFVGPWQHRLSPINSVPSVHPFVCPFVRLSVTHFSRNPFIIFSET